jgi:hypothetical protein
MQPTFRQPRKRRQTLANIPHLRAFLRDDEKLPLLRVGLDLLTRHLLTELAVMDNLAEATWFSQLAYRLHKEKKLLGKIKEYAETAYFDLPRTAATVTQLFTIPEQLKKILVESAEEGPFVDPRGVTSTWLRAAICYVAFVEKDIQLSSVPPHIFLSK